MDKDLLQYCRDFTGRGLRLFPVARNKKPCITKWQEKATIDMAQIGKWADQFKDCNFAVLAGKESGVVVLDVDVKNNQPGLISLEKLEDEFGSLDTLQIKTPSGGYHHYFQYPEGDGELRNKNEIPEYPGIEFKAYHAGCVIPGSCYADGRRYTVETNADIAELPAGVLEIVAVRAKVKTTLPEGRRIPEGTRSNTLFGKACGYIRNGYESDEVKTMLEAYNQKYGDPPLPGDELSSILASAAKKIEDTGMSLEHAGLNDMFNAERFLSEYGDIFRYDERPRLKTLYGYDGIRWKPDARSMAITSAEQTVLRMYPLLARIVDEAQRKRFFNHVCRSQNLPNLNRMIDLAVNFDPAIIKEPHNYFDQDMYLFNCLNGTFDLREGELRKHNPADFITQVCPLNYNPDANCVEWEMFISTITRGDSGFMDYIQKICGYTLCGSTGAKLWFIVYGDTDTGKSTFLNTLLRALGPDYGVMTELDTLLVRQTYRIPADLHRIKSARMVLAAETGETEKRKLNIPLIKSLTGGEYDVSRELYGQLQESDPTLKLFLGTNHYPEAPPDDPAFWRRARILPFTYKIPDDQQIPDYMKVKLMPELEGILAWCIRGFKMWRDAEQLAMPLIVQEACGLYHTAMDDVKQFIDEFCVIGPEYRVSLKDMYFKYCYYAEKDSREVLGRKKFNARMRGLGYVDKSLPAKTWLGIRLCGDSELG